MNKAIWAVKFETIPPGMVGSGITVLDDGKAHGGDHGFYWIGTYTLNGNALSGRVRVRRHTLGVQSVFGAGGSDNYELDVSGTVSGSTIAATGQVVGGSGKTMKATFTHLADLP